MNVLTRLITQDFPAGEIRIVPALCQFAFQNGHHVGFVLRAEMGVDHGHSNARMSHQFGDCSETSASHHQVTSERMT